MQKLFERKSNKLPYCSNIFLEMAENLFEFGFFHQTKSENIIHIVEK